jgi:hypothetical protein
MTSTQELVPVTATAAPDTPVEPKRILIATPCYGGQVTEGYLQSILNLIKEAWVRGVDVDVYTSAGDSLVTRARNDAVNTFLTHEKNYTHLMFIDADIIFTWDNFERLLNSGKEIAAGMYPLKTINWDRILNREFPSKVEMVAETLEVVINMAGEVEEGGFAPCLDAGTGFMLIERGVFEKMMVAYPERKYTKDGLGDDSTETFAFFDTMIHEGRYLSEDYFFCRQWQQLGGFVYVDMRTTVLVHQGVHRFGKV